MENEKSKFVNAVMIICPILIWACLFAVMFIENTTADMYIIGFQLAVLVFQLAVFWFQIAHIRKKKKFYEN